MKKFLILSLVATAFAANADVLYDHSTADAGGTNFVNQEFSDFPTFSTYQVDDATFANPVVIQKVTIWTDRNNTTWLTGLTTCRLNVYAKSGPLPLATDDPTTGQNVSVVITNDVNNGLNSYKIVATLSTPIPEPPGSYWIGLTPELAFGTNGQCFTRGGTGAPIGDLAAFRNPGNGFAFGTNWQTVNSHQPTYFDVCMLVEGTSGSGEVTIPPTGFSLFRGVLESGGLPELAASDDMYLVARNGVTALRTESPITLDTNATAPTQTASSLKFRVEDHVSITGLTQRIDMFNFTLGQYANLSVLSATTTDSVTTVTAPTPNDFIELGTKVIKSRTRIRADGPVFTNTWRGFFDQTVWLYTP